MQEVTVNHVQNKIVWEASQQHILGERVRTRRAKHDKPALM